MYIIRPVNVPKDTVGGMEDYLIKLLLEQETKGFLFKGDKNVTHTANTHVSTHSTATGGHISDHVAHMPHKVVLRGYTGEIMFTNTVQLLLEEITHMTNNAFGSFMQTLQSKIHFSNKEMQSFARTFFGMGATEVSLSVLTPGMQQLYRTRIFSEALNIRQRLLDVKKKVTNILSENEGTEQKKAYNQLSAIQKAGQFVEVTTPYTVKQYMQITRLTMTQHKGTHTVSDIEVVLQQMRIANHNAKNPIQYALGSYARATQQEEKQGLITGSQVTPNTPSYSFHQQGMARLRAI